ncbi:5'-3' exoribonuclease 2 homolog [Artemia franciscana]|uniref:5'-3' exoribonuclease 2 homolog n=1 Tax=Artemia franciscana TaxID=6661 RepID=UPI0032DA427E
MGVPAFFRWLCRKYPSVVTDCVEQSPRNGEKVDSSASNPNDVEFDNLYLDMNGIIHPCTHPEDRPAPKNEDEMMVAIFEAIDRLFNIVRPRKVLYMAIDGVAPRAKMNQQRSRRFRASKETAEKQKEMARIRGELLAQGCELPPLKEGHEHFDSNCITPGTPFMTRLRDCLHYYIHERLSNNPGWFGIKVILSDASVPGEGEHKIQDYVRKQRAQPGHDPNTQHVLCGADADLIMLGLATHEPNFTIIREDIRGDNPPRPCDMCGQIGHEMAECRGLPKEKSGENDELLNKEIPAKPFIFLRLSVLRKYLAKELEMPNLPFPYDFERAVDDWVFMCFFVGNDFLPHLPSLEIREQAIDRLVTLYKDCVYKTGGWLTESGFFTASRVQIIMNELGKVEDEIFRERQKKEKIWKEQDKLRKRGKMDLNSKPKWVPGGQFEPKPIGRQAEPLVDAHRSIQEVRTEAFRREQSANYSVAASMKTEFKNFSEEVLGGDKRGIKRPLEEEEVENPDEVRLWEDGFKDRYYESKFHVLPDNLDFREHVGHEYLLGLAWVLQYYYQGCPSWEWFFPYHYACFASDFINLSDVNLEFPKDTKPFFPLEQLMAVFPAASRSHVPKPWGELMIDPESDIADFYPSDFMIDLNGKNFAWQGVALLPFVDEKRLKETLKKHEHLLTSQEKKRNTRGEAILYTGNRHKSYRFMRAFYSEGLTEVTVIESAEFEGMGGRITTSEICVEAGGTLDTPVDGLPDLYSVDVVCVSYMDPQYSSSFVFESKPLPGAKSPPAQLKSYDLAKIGRSFRGRGGGSGRGFNNMGPRTHQASIHESGHRHLNFALQGPDRNYGGFNSSGSNEHCSYNSVPPYQKPSYNDAHPYQRPSYALQSQERNYGAFNSSGPNGQPSYNNDPPYQSHAYRGAPYAPGSNRPVNQPNKHRGSGGYIQARSDTYGYQSGGSHNSLSGPRHSGPPSRGGFEGSNRGRQSQSRDSSNGAQYIPRGYQRR